MPGKHRRPETIAERLADYGRTVATVARMVGDTLILNPTPRTIGLTANVSKAEVREVTDADRP